MTMIDSGMYCWLRIKPAPVRYWSVTPIHGRQGRGLRTRSLSADAANQRLGRGMVLQPVVGEADAYHLEWLDVRDGWDGLRL